MVWPAADVVLAIADEVAQSVRLLRGSAGPVVTEDHILALDLQLQMDMEHPPGSLPRQRAELRMDRIWNQLKKLQVGITQWVDGRRQLWKFRRSSLPAQTAVWLRQERVPMSLGHPPALAGRPVCCSR